MKKEEIHLALKKNQDIKVNFGLLDDIKSDFSFIEKNIGSSYDAFWDAIETASNHQKLLKGDLSKIDNLEKQILRAQSQLKDLGLDSQISQLDKTMEKVKQYNKDLTRVLSVKI